LDRNAAILAELAFTELRQIVQPEIDVISDEKIEIAVPIVIGPRGARREARIAYAGFISDVFECTVTAIVV